MKQSPSIKATRWGICASLLFLALGSAGVTSATLAQSIASGRPILGTTTRDWTIQVVSDALDYPWDIVHDGNRLILTEKAGSIVMIEGGTLRRFALETSDPLRKQSGAGLLGIALAPDFAANGNAFFYHSYERGSFPLNRIIRARFNGSVWRETGVLVDAIPGHPLYNGGRIAIGPDGHLYATTGWTENRDRPQDLGNLAGKVLRLTLDGAVPADNPFPASLVYSYGHRNPQGIAWNNAGELFVAEHGQTALDEINLVRPGGNYGWPIISGDEVRAGMEAPFLHSGRPTWAPSGVAFAGNDLLVAALQEGGLLVLDRANRRLVSFFDGGERYRQVLPVGGDLYVITTNRSPRRTAIPALTLTLTRLSALGFSHRRLSAALSALKAGNPH